VRLFDAADCPPAVSRAALATVDHLAVTLDFSDQASRIIHPLVRCLNNNPELRPVAMETLCAIVLQLGYKFSVFVPLVKQVMTKHKITCEKYDTLETIISSVSRGN